MVCVRVCTLFQWNSNSLEPSLPYSDEPSFVFTQEHWFFWCLPSNSNSHTRYANEMQWNANLILVEIEFLHSIGCWKCMRFINCMLHLVVTSEIEWHRYGLQQCCSNTVCEESCSSRCALENNIRGCVVLNVRGGKSFFSDIVKAHIDTIQSIIYHVNITSKLMFVVWNSMLLAWYPPILSTYRFAVYIAYSTK